MNVDDSFRANLEVEMLARGMNPASLSRAAGLNARAVTDILSGVSRSPKISTAYSLAKALNLTIEDLIHGARPDRVKASVIALLSRYPEEKQEAIAQALAAIIPDTVPK